MDGPQKDEMYQIANIVIDAYLRRHDVFQPTFSKGDEGIMYLSENEDGSNNDKNGNPPRLHFWYEKSDY